jgi:FkbM family methyltransferase
MSIKHLTRRLLNSIGYDIVRLSNSPRRSLLGLTHFPIKSILDIGANTGQFAQNVLAVFPDARLYCFEPLAQPFAELRLLSENYSGRIYPFNLALGEKQGTFPFHHHRDHSASSSFLTTTEVCKTYYPFTDNQDQVHVQLTTLDDWLGHLPSPPSPDILIKLDVQGYEDRVIRGGRIAFGIAKACIIEIALDPLYQEQPFFHDLLLILKNLGYRYAGNLDQTFAPDGHVIYLDALFLR